MPQRIAIDDGNVSIKTVFFQEAVMLSPFSFGLKRSRVRNGRPFLPYPPVVAERNAEQKKEKDFYERFEHFCCGLRILVT